MEKNKKDQRNSLLGLLLVAGVVFYIWKTRKPKAYAVESGESGGGSGGGGGAFPIFIPTPAPAPSPAPATTPQPVFKQKGDSGMTVTCGSGYIYNPATRACEPIKPVQQAPEDALKKAQEAANKAGSGLGPAPVGGGTTSGSPTAPPIGGGSTQRPIGGGGTLPTCPKGYMYNSVTRQCVKMDDGEVGGGGMLFSGKMPLTLDNILH
jgi:hypothetical protein